MLITPHNKYTTVYSIYSIFYLLFTYYLQFTVGSYRFFRKFRVAWETLAKRSATLSVKVS